MTKEKNPINFKLNSIKTDQFEIIENKKTEDTEYQVDVLFGFKISPDNRIISSLGEVKFERSDISFIKLHLSCNFQIEENSWKELLESENSFRIPKEFASHLSVIMVGTARGVLHCKLEDTPYSNYFLPTIDLSGTFKDDVVITKQ